MNKFDHIKDISAVPADDYYQYQEYLDYLYRDDTSIIIEKFEQESNREYYQHIWTLDIMNRELVWATRYFALSKVEAFWFKRCYYTCLVQGEGWYPSPKITGSYPPPELLEGIDDLNQLLLIALYRIFFHRMIEYAEDFLPADFYLDPEVISSDTPTYVVQEKILKILHNYTSQNSTPTMGQTLSQFCSENKRLLYFLIKADRITLEIKDKAISKVSIHNPHNKGSYKANSTQIEMLNDLREEGSNLLSEINRGQIITDSKEISILYDLWKSQMYFPYENKTYVFGPKKNTSKKHFVHSLKPLYRILKDRFRVQDSNKFATYTNRNFYNYIIDFLDIPNIMASPDDLEYYLKKEK